MMSVGVQTWHYGLVARWWAEFGEGGDDLEFFQDAIRRCGEPVSVSYTHLTLPTILLV